LLNAKIASATHPEAAGIQGAGHWHPSKTIYNTILSFTVCGLVVAYLRRDVIVLMLIGALIFTALYLLLLYPDFVQRSYNVPNLLGIYIFRVPIEELMFGASGGPSGALLMSTCKGTAFRQEDLSDLCRPKGPEMESWPATRDRARGPSHHAEGWSETWMVS
jgi:lycopene cyclase-like protein